jgi:hypothetical protein
MYFIFLKAEIKQFSDKTGKVDVAEEKLFGMQELGPCRGLTVLTPEGNRRVGKPQMRWLE